MIIIKSYIYCLNPTTGLILLKVPIKHSKLKFWFCMYLKCKLKQRQTVPWEFETFLFIQFLRIKKGSYVNKFLKQFYQIRCSCIINNTVLSHAKTVR